MKILFNGISGQMGQAFMRVKDDRFTVVGGIDTAPSDCGVPVFTAPNDVNIDFDIVIDFSVPKATPGILQFCIDRKKPLVIGTTGIKEPEKALIAQAAAEIPIFYTGNMSLGVNLQLAVSKLVAGTLGDDAEIEIIEKHHNKKNDAPSGTAIMLFNSINEALDGRMEPKYGRGPSDGRRKKNEIGVHSVRGGTIVGEHEVIFLCEDEAITITHQAFSKRVFVNGALRAAEFLLEQAPGCYSMQDMVK